MSSTTPFFLKYPFHVLFGAGAYVQKDAAIALFCAVAVRSSTVAGGVTSVNDQVSVGDFLRGHILPELQLNGGGALGAAGVASPKNKLEERPIVKAACIKFVATFRNQFSKDELAALLPAVAPFLGAPSYVVHTYAAAAIERMLTVKAKPGEAPPSSGGSNSSSSAGSSELRLGLDALSTQLIPIFTALFGRMTSPGYPENDYLMKALMRIVVVGKERVAPFAAQVIGGLTTILARVCANPSNPGYNHFLFETIAALMKNVCGTRPEAVADFEGMLFPPFQVRVSQSASFVYTRRRYFPWLRCQLTFNFSLTLSPCVASVFSFLLTLLLAIPQSVLVNDVMEFLPYVFQLLAELLELRPGPPPGESALTDGYKSLLPPLLTAALWSRKGNVPALTSLACAYLRKGGAYVASSGQLLPLLGVFQKLLSTKGQEDSAFEIGRALVEGVQWPALAPHFPTLLQLLLMKLQESKAIRIARQFVHWAGLLAGVHGAGVLESGLNGLGPGLYFTILESVLVPMANRVAGAAARKETVVGLARMLTDAPSGPGMVTDPSRAALWGKLLSAAVEVAEPQPLHLEGGTGPKPVAASSSAGGLPNGTASSLGGGVGAADGGFVSEEAELEAVVEAVESEYTAAYSRLVFAQIRDRYAFATSAPDVKRHLATSLAQLAASMPGRLLPLIQGTPVAATVGAYCAAAGVTIQ